MLMILPTKNGEFPYVKIKKDDVLQVIDREVPLFGGEHPNSLWETHSMPLPSLILIPIKASHCHNWFTLWFRDV